MKVLVMGAGVVGVTTAWQLVKDGHEVVLVERLSAAADETSFGNAGAIAPGHAYAWSSPRAPMTLLRSLWRNDQALRFRFSLDPALWSWSWKFLRQCTAERYRRNTQTKHRLCNYSKAVLHEVVAETGIDYDRQAGGILYCYRDPRRLREPAAGNGDPEGPRRGLAGPRHPSGDRDGTGAGRRARQTRRGYSCGR